jgi:thioredoxin 1
VGGVVLVGGWYLFVNNNDDAAKMAAEKATTEEKTMMEKEAMEKAEMEKRTMEEKVMMEKDDSAMDKDENGAMMKKEDQAMTGDEAMMKKAGAYAPYDASKLAMANSGDVVLFFKASWCPSCRTLDNNIKANLEAIPAGLTILEVDYDSATTLKQKYGVTTQHTLVQVDASGNLIEKWSGSPTLAAVVAKVQ